jgi:hypothetical protein
MSPSPDNAGSPAVFLEESDEDGDLLIGDDDDDGEEFLVEDGLLNGAEESSETDVPAAFSSMDEPGND